ncbi:hypothetical protein, partial [Sphingobacterium chuzhouense]
MRSLFKYFVVLQILTFSLYNSSFAQQDSLISFDDVEFTDGSVDAGEDTLLEIPDDLVFEEGTASGEDEEGQAVGAPVQPVDASDTEQQ